jgi:hypothetical protein
VNPDHITHMDRQGHITYVYMTGGQKIQVIEDTVDIESLIDKELIDE